MQTGINLKRGGDNTLESEPTLSIIGRVPIQNMHMTPAPPSRLPAPAATAT